MLLRGDDEAVKKQTQEQLDREVGKIVRHIFDGGPQPPRGPGLRCPRCNRDGVLMLISTGTPVTECSCGYCRHKWQGRVTQ